MQLKKQIKYLLINNLYIIILIFCSHTVNAQIFDDDQNPPGVKWKQIQTPLFQLIFPAEFDQEAQRLANILTEAIPRESKTLGKKPRKISIILQNRDVVSNGFVQLAPRRSEFSTTPPQRTDYQDWLNSLAVHELRHVVQFDKLTGYLGPPLFEQLALAIFGITLPPWFYEGDAVGTETILSTAGRGRLPSWELQFRTNTLSKKKYSYQKDYLGSLKDVTPGYYPLGYFMTTKIRRDYGGQALEKLMTRMAGNPIRPYNFSNSLKQLTGYNTKDWHQKTVEELDSIWHEQEVKTAPLDYPLFPQPKSGEVVDFLLPTVLPNGELLALEKSNHSVSKIVLLSPENGAKEIIKTGIQTEPHFSYGGGKITWDELRYNKRYLKETFQVVNVYDLTQKTYKQLTSKTRLFSPALSTDGTKIAAVEVDLSNHCYLVILNSENGEVQQRIALPPHLLLQTPTFNSDGTKVIATALGQQGTSIMEIVLQSKETKLLLPWQAQQIERPIYFPKGIIFKAHYNGIDNLYLLKNQQTIKQLTNIRFGANNPFWDSQSQRLYFNNYQVNGYLISSLAADSIQTQELSPDANHFISYFKPLVAQETPLDTPEPHQKKTFACSAYKDVGHLFNFHSISPVGDDLSTLDNFDLGLRLLSDNLLNTFSTEIGFNYDQDISRADYFVKASFKRWFPKITLQYRNQAQLSSVRLQNKPDERLPFRWREHYTEIKTTIPLTFTRLNTVYNTGFALGTSYTTRYQLSLKNLSLPNFNEVKFPLLAQYYFNRNSRKSLLDLAPKWGQNFNIIYRSMTFDKRLSGELLSIKSTFYFPGLVNNHTLQLRFNGQQRSGDYKLTNDIPMVSGYDQLHPTRVNNTLFVDYKFPIAYPDLTIGPLAFIKRLKGGLFADFENFAQQHAVSPRTFGLELRADMNLLRFYLPNFDAGVRAIYVNESNPQKIVFTYGVSYSY